MTAAPINCLDLKSIEAYTVLFWLLPLRKNKKNNTYKYDSLFLLYNRIENLNTELEKKKGELRHYMER